MAGKELLNQTQAIAVGSYTIVQGVLAMDAVGIPFEFMKQQLIQFAAEYSTTIPDYLVPIIDAMAVGVAGDAAKAFGKETKGD